MGAAENRFRFGIALRRISGASPAHDILISTTICWWRCWCCYRDTNLCLPLIDVLHIIIIFMQISNKERSKVIIANVWCVYRLGCQILQDEVRYELGKPKDLLGIFKSVIVIKGLYLFKWFSIYFFIWYANRISSQITEKQIKLWHIQAWYDINTLKFNLHKILKMDSSG